MRLSTGRPRKWDTDGVSPVTEIISFSYPSMHACRVDHMMVGRSESDYLNWDVSRKLKRNCSLHAEITAEKKAQQPKK